MENVKQLLLSERTIRIPSSNKNLSAGRRSVAEWNLNCLYYLLLVIELPAQISL